MLEQETKIKLSINKARPNKRLGQNFCIDPTITDDIIDCSNISKDDIVLEIGPGTGILTKKLAKKAKKVIAIEIDTKMIEILKKELKYVENVDIINADIMQFNDIENIGENKKIKVVANIPYYITTPIIMHLLKYKKYIDSITLMVQKEVALRICASPSSKNYGSVTLLLNYHTDTKFIRIVPKIAFLPIPKVDSAVVYMKICDKAKIKAENEENLFTLIRTSFLQRRKTLINSLSNQKIFNLKKEKIQKAFLEAGFDLKIRAENLSLEDFEKLCKILNHQ